MKIIMSSGRDCFSLQSKSGASHKAVFSGSDLLGAEEKHSLTARRLELLVTEVWLLSRDVFDDSQGGLALVWRWFNDLRIERNSIFF